MLWYVYACVLRAASNVLTTPCQLFSALYSMLPSSKKALQEGDFSSRAAAWTLVGCFLGGAVGIQFLSRVLHNMLPSHVVECDHSHDEVDSQHTHHHQENHLGRHRRKSTEARHEQDRQVSETSPLLPTSAPAREPLVQRASPPPVAPVRERPQLTAQPAQRPPLPKRLSSRVSQLVSGSKSSCDENGPCYGHSDPCGQECFKLVQSRGSRTPAANHPRHPWIGRRASTHETHRRPLLQGIDERRPLGQIQGQRRKLSESALSHMQSTYSDSNAAEAADAIMSASNESHSGSGDNEEGKEGSLSHHHHVPRNAFLSIGLQVPIAIALHKLPEGFITYATNHANPTLGFAVFLALFTHNITEGFAMALPLYLAVNSKTKAIVLTFILGGCSQPLGAGVAALCFKVAGRTDFRPGEGVYGVMFAITGMFLQYVMSFDELI